MRFRFSKTASDAGVIMVIALIVIMVMVIASVTILSQSLSQSKTGDDQVKQIVAEQLAKGVFWSAYNSGVSSSSSTITTGSRPSQPINKHSYTPKVEQNVDGCGPNCYKVTVSY